MKQLGSVNANLTYGRKLISVLIITLYYIIIYVIILYNYIIIIL